MTMDFRTFDLHPNVLRAVNDLEYEEPTPIQARAIPKLMAGQDILGQAQTGTGKTAAFALPMLHAMEHRGDGVQGLIVVPTRELANQVAKAVYGYGRHHGARVLAIYGGQSYSRQIGRLKRGVDIVVGTPGRMLDLIRKGVLDLTTVRYVVLDEADEMLSMGFIEDIEAILDATPTSRQTSLFSATLPAPIQRLAERYMREPEAVTVNAQHMTVADTEQRYYLVNQHDKLAALTRLLEVEDVTSALIFTRTRVGSAELADALLARGLQAEALHGDLSQAARETVMGHFRRGQTTLMVATDVAARGLDIDDISHVINYDIPFDPEAYVHRIGRTGRAGKSGIALTLVTPRERRRLRKIEAYTSKSIAQAKLPTAEEVLAKREAQFAETMRAELVQGDAQRRDLVIKLCAEGHDLVDVAAAAIRLLRADEEARPIENVSKVRERRRSKRHHKSKRGKSRKRNRRKRRHEPGMIQFTLGAGRQHGIRPRDVVGAIANEAGIPGRAIGAIEIQQKRTLVDIAEKHASRVQHKLPQCQIHGNEVELRTTK